jgi:hypothetical protein
MMGKVILCRSVIYVRATIGLGARVFNLSRVKFSSQFNLRKVFIDERCIKSHGG